MTVRFSNQLVAELIQPFSAACQAGEFMTDASAVAGTYRNRGLTWVRQAGLNRPKQARRAETRPPTVAFKSLDKRPKQLERCNDY